MTSWTNLMPLQYLKDTNCCSLLPPGGAAVEKGRREIPGNCKSEKKDRQEKKLNEFWRLCKRRAWVWEMNVLIFGVQGFSPCKKTNKHCIDAEINFCSQAKMP